MNVVLPKNKGPNHGLHRVDSGTYYVRWTEDGKQRIQSTGTKDVKEARQIRERLYERFEREKGAVRVGSVEHALASDKFIYYRKPYLVKLKGHKIHACETRQEARELRNRLLGVNADGDARRETHPNQQDG